MSTLPSPSPFETSLTEMSQEKLPRSSSSSESESIDNNVKWPKYPSRDGRSWYRKDDPPPEQPQYSEMLFGIQAIALFCGVSYSTVKGWIAAGLPVYPPLRRRYWIHPYSLFNWLTAAGYAFQHEVSQYRTDPVKYREEHGIAPRPLSVEKTNNSNKST